jgi:pilus assembly protein CpaF
MEQRIFISSARVKLHRVPVTFENNDHVLRIIDRIVAPLGRRIDESSPYVDARLQDGSSCKCGNPSNFSGGTGFDDS